MLTLWVRLALDVCVPVSKLPQLCAETQADLRANGIVGPLLG